MLLNFMALLISIVPMVSAQENAIHQGETGDSQSVIVTARTRSSLSCESGDIVVKVNFTQPFRGLMYAHRSRNSPCRVHGTGGSFYQLRIPLKGCGTWQETPRVFVNNVTIRFHPALELEEDETKTVVCRYPPPLTPAPGSIVVIEPPTVGPNPPTRINTAKLSEVEILIIICLLLFLSLLTLGIGIAYFCLKRRNIHIVRKSATASSAPPSQITRLSSSNIPPPSSLLSSVLGHTVRIPRAVPYSAPVGRASMLSSPEHQYEEYPVSTSTTSAEVSETSVSSSSDDQNDGSKRTLFRKIGPRTLLSIPKAILRKTGPKKWRGEPQVHNYYSRASSSGIDATIRIPEMEDQTVTTVLEPEGLVDEDDRYYTIRNGVDQTNRKTLHQTMEFQKSDSSKRPIPVYAQVDKNKKIISKGHEINIDKLNILKPEPKVARIPARPAPSLLGAARRQRSIITDIPEESSTSEEITKNTTITTSVRREVTETRIISPGRSSTASDFVDAATEISSSDSESHFFQTEDSEIQTTDQTVALHQSPKSILIRDVADVYLTTTVETESRELKTHVSRDVVEEHTRKDATTSPQKDVPSTEPKTSSPTNNWNVVIGQRQPPPSLQATTLDVDTSSEISAKEEEKPQPEVKPKFDVKIRTIPPNELKPKEPAKMVTIPPLEMPETVSKLKEALMPKTAETPEATELPDTDPDLKDKQTESKEKTDSPQRSVRWTDDAKRLTKDSTMSSSDSFQSAESLRERSSSEVLEVAPTLPSQQKASGRPVLERSSSEIVTSPEDHVRWVGGVVPVLENLSPEFLENIPVIQGGFFNQQTVSSPKDKQRPAEI